MASDAAAMASEAAAASTSMASEAAKVEELALRSRELRCRTADIQASGVLKFAAYTQTIKAILANNMAPLRIEEKRQLHNDFEEEVAYWTSVTKELVRKRGEETRRVAMAQT